MSEPDRNAAASTSARPRALPAWSRPMLRALGWLAGGVAAGGVAVLMLLAVALSVAYPNLPEISGLTDYRPKLPLRVISADGVLLGEFGEERRHFTPIDRIPPVMQQA